MSKAGSLAQRIGRATAAPAHDVAITQPSPSHTMPAARPPGRDRRRTVRITFDLEADLHRRLRQFALDTEVTAADVIRAALRLLDDPVINRALLEEIDRG